MTQSTELKRRAEEALRNGQRMHDWMLKYAALRYLHEASVGRAKRG